MNPSSSGRIRSGPAAPSITWATPVDLQSYTIRRQDGESSGMGARLARRSPVALTMPADPALAPAVGDGTEPPSPIDVPAFLRRLNEA